MNEPLRDREETERKECRSQGFSSQEELLEAIENLRLYLNTLKSWKEIPRVKTEGTPPSLN